MSEPLQRSLVAITAPVPSSSAASSMFGDLNTSTYSDAVELLLVEFERHVPMSIRSLNTLHRTSQRLSSTLDILEACSVITEEVRLLGDYDRVLMYRFDKEWHGDVIAEYTAPSVPPLYLGLRFPASDIPAQARMLYAVNTLRVISDANYTPSPILPVNNPLTGCPLDLSFATYRSVSPVHLFYLKNINVHSSASISLLINDPSTQQKRLWGLIVCHHGRPKVVPSDVRRMFQVLGNTLSSRIENMIHNKLEEKRIAMKALVAQVSGQESSQVSDHPLVSLTSHQPSYNSSLLQLFSAEYALVSVHGLRRFIGDMPEDDVPFVNAFELFLLQKRFTTIFHSENVRKAYPEAFVTFDRVHSTSGFLYIPLSLDASSFMVLFRLEQLSEVKWAGAPQKQYGVHPATQQPSMMPRASFEMWVEQVRGQSQTWSDLEIETAQTMFVHIMYLMRIVNLQTRIMEESFIKETLAREKVAAEEAARSKGQFLANLSHEVRTPLNAIIGMVDLTLSTTPVDNTQSEYLAAVQHASEALLHIINDLLDISKIESGKMVMHQDCMDLHKLLVECASIYKAVLRERGVSLLLSVAPDTPRFILSDTVRLRQVISNLLSNAQKYTNEGKIIIRVSRIAEFTPVDVGRRSSRAREIRRTNALANKSSLSNTTGTETQALEEERGIKRSLSAEDIAEQFDAIVRVSIEDTGIGIPAEKLAVIFHMFEQVDNSLTRQAGGTGLGLSICFQIISLMHGQIWCESELGKGTNLILEFPVRIDPLEKSQQTAASLQKVDSPLSTALQRLSNAEPLTLTSPSLTSASAPASMAAQSTSLTPLSPTLSSKSPSPSHRPAPYLQRRRSLVDLRVLAVDDNLLNQKVIANLLRQLGIKPDIAGDGQDAFNRVQNAKQPYNLIFMDVCMPVMDGLTATRQIRQLEVEGGIEHVTIIGLSALVMDSDRKACRDAGMDGFLEKPIKLGALQNIIKPLIEDVQPGSSSPSI
eukprot:TRINITY_DN4502_c0_g1_i1.p1 TRINITY_DN4502_c0_g1~~TRINITY_DN4502_c0_g1_i1.p1  ORF type:complete len:1082 (-),score=290.45 TRINITY_DN4502_c0_g1_i1:163-3117(-)